jgi:hypothetical protein
MNPIQIPKQIASKVGKIRSRNKLKSMIEILMTD